MSEENVEPHQARIAGLPAWDRSRADSPREAAGPARTHGSHFDLGYQPEHTTQTREVIVDGLSFLNSRYQALNDSLSARG
jgi:hypothetical protein